MRKLLISILLAGVATSPAFAQDRHRDRDNSEERQEARQERQQQREERQQAREQRQEQRVEMRTERAEPSNIQQAQPRTIERAQPQFEQRRESVEGRPQRVQRASGTSRWTRDDVQQPGETSRFVRDPSQRAGETSRWTRDRTSGRDGGGDFRGGDLRRGDRPVPNVMRNPNPLIVSDAPREGTQPRLRSQAHRSLRPDWSTNWRRDHRHDWRGWRDRHRSLFRIGIYYDPFGWNYRPYQIGWRLWPSYYSSRYWINDPWQYRLPYAPAGTVWIRYWDDAVLVDRWTGEVVDVIHNFFW